MTVIQPLQRNQTDAIAMRVPVNGRASRWENWRVAVSVLMFMFVLSPAIPFIPRPDMARAFIGSAQPTPGSTGVTESCPPIGRCVVKAVEQALPRLPVPPLLPLALLVLVLAVQWRDRPPAIERDWWPPPGRRRALLQVFLI
ncbi:MAG: hypothetical protein ACYDAR_09115 [Thermomicrobiales bacterium]